LLSATILGFTAIAVLGRPGEFVRPYLIAAKERVPLASQLAAWMLERVFDLLMALILFGFALSRVSGSALRAGSKLAWVLGAGGKIVAAASLAVLILLVLLRHFTAPAKRWLSRVTGFLPQAQFLRIEKLATAFEQGVESMRSDTALLSVLFYSLLEWATIWAVFQCLAGAFPELNFTFVDVLVVLGFVTFGSLVQIPGIGGGVQVVTVIVLTELFRVGLELATAFALTLWLFTFVAIIPVGLILAIREGLSWRKLSRVGPQTEA